MKKILIILMIVMGLNIIEVKANNSPDAYIKLGHYIPDIYINKVEPNGTVHSGQSLFLRRLEDNMWVYCVEPGILINQSALYQGITDNILGILEISKDTWERVNLIAYYGYNYQDNDINHTDDKWYAITQFMIWDAVKIGKGWDFYFTDKVWGNRIDNPFQNEMNEIYGLIEKHNMLPSFSDTNIKIGINETVELKDKNNVLGSFILNNNDLGITKNDNSLIIKGNKVGKTVIKLKKEMHNYGNLPMIYISNISQDVMVTGDLDTIETSFNIEVYQGKIKLEKRDYDTKNSIGISKSGTLEGAIYGIYKVNGEKIGTLVTDINGYAESKYLNSIGDFYLLEEKASLGYQLDKEKYYFRIDENNLSPTIVVYEKIIRGNILIIKKDKDSKLTIPNVKINIYDVDNKLVYQGLTNNKGEIIVNDLMYGKYYIKEINAPGYIVLDEIIEFEIDRNNQEIRVEIENEKIIRGKVLIIKKDKDTKLVIPNVEFNIYDVDNKLVYQGLTNKKGEIIVDDLVPGKYYIKEINAPGYIVLEDIIEFEIDRNNQEIRVEIENEKNITRIIVPNTALNENVIIKFIGYFILIISISYFAIFARFKNN